MKYDENKKEEICVIGNLPEKIVKNRREAKKNGDRFYFGKLCVNCGCLIRLTSNANCYPCFLKFCQSDKQKNYLAKYRKTLAGKKQRKESTARFRNIEILYNLCCGSREEAIERKFKFYQTDTPCGRGHFSKKYTKTAACIECSREINKKHSQKRRTSEKAEKS